MHRVLERLDALGGTLVPLAYLAGLLLGTMTYFAGSASLSPWVVAVGLAVGSELHAFLQQRRARAAWADYQRLTDADTGKGAARKHFRTQAYILAGLIAFQCFTGIGYAASNWHPAGPLALVVLQLIVRGCVIPVLFLLASFLVPLHESPGAVLAQASQDILHFAVRRNVKHWYKRIRRVHSKGGDLSPLMVALLHEEGEDGAARRTALIAANLQTAEGELRLRPGFWDRLRGRIGPETVAGALIAPAPHDVTELTLARPNMQAGSDLIVRRKDAPGVLELVTDEGERGERGEKPPRLTRQTRAKGAGKGDGRRKPRRRDAGRETPAKEQRIVKLMAQLRRDPAMTIEDVAEYLDVSRGTAVTDRAEAKRRLREENA